MECKGTEEKPGPSGGSDLIIITPDELAKLGLFKNIQAIAESSKMKNSIESTNKSVKPKERKKTVEKLKSTTLILNETQGTIKGKSPLNLKGKILGKSSNLLSESVSLNPRQKVLNSEINIITKAPEGIVKSESTTNTDGPTILNSNFLNKNIDQSSLSSKNKSPSKLNKVHPACTKVSVFKSANSQPKILNAEFGLEKRKFVIAQKKIDPEPIIHKKQISGKKCLEKSIAQQAKFCSKKNPAAITQNTKSTDNSSTKVSNKEPEVINSKFTYGSVVEETLSRNSLPLKKYTSLETTLRRGLSRILQKDQPSSDQPISESAIVIDDNSDLDVPITSVKENKKRISLKKVSISSQNVNRLEATESEDNASLEIINLEKSGDPSEQLNSPSGFKNEVNIISNTPVRLSNEELKRLISKPKISTESSILKKLSFSENTHAVQNVAKHSIAEEYTSFDKMKKNVPSQITTSSTVNKTVVRNQRPPPKLLMLPKSVSVIKSDIEKKNLQKEEIGNVYETVEWPERTVKNGKNVYNINPCDIKQVDCEDERNDIQGKSNIEHKLFDKNEDRYCLPSTSRLIDDQSQHDTHQKEIDRKCESKNSSNSETGKQLKSFEKKSTNLNNGSTLVKSKRINMEQENMKSKIEESSIKNIHTPAYMDVKRKEKLNKNLCDANINVTLDDQGLPNESTVSKKQKDTLKKSNIIMRDKANRIRKIKGSGTFIHGIEEDTPVTKSKNKNTKNREIKLQTIELTKGHKTYERKKKINESKSSVIANEEVIGKTATTKVNTSLQKMNETIEVETISGQCNTSSLKNKDSARDNLKTDLLPKQEAQTGRDTVKRPRKKGRPKKIVRLQEIQPENEPVLLTKIQEQITTSTPLPPKRGRKRKSMIVIMEDVAQDCIEPLMLSNDINKNTSNLSRCKADSNEKNDVISNLEHQSTSNLKNEANTKFAIANVDIDVIPEVSSIKKLEETQTHKDISVKAPRKRGRPKKIVKLGGIQEESESVSQRQETDTKFESKNTPETEVELKSTGKNSKDLNNDLTLMECTAINMEQGDTKLCTEESEDKDRCLHKKDDIQTDDKKNQTNNLNGSKGVTDGINKDTCPSQEKTMTNRGIEMMNKESIKIPESHERKKRPKEYESSVVAKEGYVSEATDKTENTKANINLENTKAVPKNIECTSELTSFNVLNKNSSDSAGEFKGDKKTSDDMDKNKPNISRDHKTASNETVQVESLLEECNTSLENKDHTRDNLKDDPIPVDSPICKLEESQSDKETFAILPKKRGRKRKSMIVITEDSTEDFTEAVVCSAEVNKNKSNISRDHKTDSNEVASKLEHFNSIENEDSTKENLKADLIPEQSLINKQEEAQIDTDTSVKLPRKRGRPKRVANLEELHEESEPTTSLEKSHLEMITSTPLPKKRGRKRKSIIVVSEDLAEDFIEPMVLEESINGRKRRKVDYFQMENFSTDEEEEYSKRRKRKTDNRVKGSARSKTCSNDNVSPLLITNKTVDDQIISEVNQSAEDIIQNNEAELKTCIQNNDTDDTQENTEQKNIGETVHTNSNQCDVTEKNENDIKTDDIDKSKNKKGRKSANQNTMLNSVFTAALRNNSNVDSVAEGEEVGASNTGLITTDHQTKEAIGSSIATNGANMVTCMTCKNKINNDEWNIHNRNVHYYLAWREGEPELNLDDKAFLTRTLTPLLKQEKKLNCLKCGKADTKVTSFIEHMEMCNGIVSSAGLVTCAVCKLEIEKTKWHLHKLKKHNNLAWRIGDHPLNLNDRYLVMNILNGLYKAKKPLICSKCGATKKSVIGFLSHQAQCGLNIEEAKIKCELCNRKVLPVSMPTHIKMVHETPKDKEIEQPSDYFNVDYSATTSKRQAAKRAMLVMDKFSREKIVQEHAKHFLQNMDFKDEEFVILLLQRELVDNKSINCKFNSCTFETEDVKTLVEHMDLCDLKPERYYTCRKCLSVYNTDEEIKKHMKEAYDIDIIDDDFKMNIVDVEENSDIDGEDLDHKETKKKKIFDKNKSERNGIIRVRHPHLYDVGQKRPGTLFPMAFEFTMNICEEYLSNPLLFDHLRYWDCEWSALDEDLVEKYLPKYLESCDVAWTKVDTFENVLNEDYTFKKFEIYETVIDEGIATIYCGGPIYAMAWMPTPYTSLNSKQILAVAPAKCFEKEYSCDKWYNEPSVIQFWDFGVLKNNQAMSEPTLYFSLAFDFGPVWHLEWCPSGCYDSTEDNGPENKLARMGLLAVAGSDGAVYIYSIPFLNKDDVGMILEVKPLLKLLLVPKNHKGVGNKEFFATKMSWTVGVGHKYIAVGYTDGLVGIFDVSTTSPLLRDKDCEDGVDIIKPIKILQAHYHYISALHLLHYDEGRRWLLTGSFDREVFFWDLKNGTKDTSGNVGKKFIVSDGVWLKNWLSYIITSDASTTYCSVHATLRSYHDHMCERVNLTLCHASIKSISASDWLNGIIHGNSAGEIQAVFPHSLFAMESEKNLKCYRYFFGTVKLINKHISAKERVAEELAIQKAFENTPNKKGNAETNTANQLSSLFEPITYEKGAAKYGLLFCDKKMDTISDFLTSKNKPKYNEELEAYRPQLYSMRAINKIAYNPNRQASLYYATGYQSGFLRVTYMKFWEKDPHLNK